MGFPETNPTCPWRTDGCCVGVPFYPRSVLFFLSIYGQPGPCYCCTFLLPSHAGGQRSCNGSPFPSHPATLDGWMAAAGRWVEAPSCPLVDSPPANARAQHEAMERPGHCLSLHLVWWSVEEGPGFGRHPTSGYSSPLGSGARDRPDRQTLLNHCSSPWGIPPPV